MNTDNKYIFITGTSESGKSMISEYIANKYKNAIHIKIRDIIKQMYIDSNTEMQYENWQNKFETEQREEFWKLYLEVANKKAKENHIIIMDTLRKVESLEIFTKLINDNLMILYIDANLENRIKREYKRLRKQTDVSYEQIQENTIKKDNEKKKSGLIKILNYISDGKLKYGYILNNNGTIEEFKDCIDKKIKIFLGDNNV